MGNFRMLMSVNDALKHARGESYVLKHKQLPLDLKTLGANIRHIREESGYSQSKLSNMAGCNRVSLSRLESGVSKVSVAKMIDIFDKLGYGIEFSLKKKTR